MCFSINYLVCFICLTACQIPMGYIMVKFVLFFKLLYLILLKSKIKMRRNFHCQKVY